MILGAGLDLVEVERLERAVARHGEEFLREILTAEEIDRCRRTSRFLPVCAAVFAAKEAFLKALGTGRAGRLSWLDITVEPLASPPGVRVGGASAEVMARRGADRLHLSLAMRRERAGAMVLLEGTPPQAESGMFGGEG